MTAPLVSTIIPTYNRAGVIALAVRSALAQHGVAQEVLVVDDGSTDDTAARLAAEFGERIRVLHQANGGVSSARNRGLAAARGDFLALLDSDDEWLPGKLAAQLALFARRPELGLVVCDFTRMDEARRDFEVCRRRATLPEDGMILRHVVRHPTLVPPTVLLRRAVFEDVGGFDTALRTAEDMDFYLRVAQRWPIGVVEEVLCRCMRGHDGLSALSSSYDDYIAVVERFVAAHGDEIPAADRRTALLKVYARSARGRLWQGDLGAALGLTARSARQVRDLAGVRELAGVGVAFARTAASRLRDRILALRG